MKLNTISLPARVSALLLIAALTLFLLSLILPNEFYQLGNSGSRPIRTFFAGLTIVSILIHSAPKVRSKKWSDPFLPFAFFLLIFVLMLNKHYRNIDYEFGADDAFYYSYLTSSIIDGDLDFTNQYQLSSLKEIMEPQFFEQQTMSGLPVNVYPAGTPVFWLPFFLIGHAIAAVSNWFGTNLQMNGYSSAHTTAVLTGNAAYIFAGLYLTYITLLRTASKLTSLVCTIGLWLTTPALYYTFPQLVSEPVSLFSVALIFYLSQRIQRYRTIFLAGLITGLSTAVRPYNFIFGLVPLSFLIQKSMRKTEEAQSNNLFPAIGVLLLGSFIGVLPQLIIWRLLNGTWFVNLSEGYLPYLNNPFITETLFSARNGLFVWSPVLIICCAGLIYNFFHERYYTATLLVVLLVCVYLNAATIDWWGSVSFGGRRFLNCFVIFATGLAALANRKSIRPRRILQAVLAVAICFLIPLNWHLIKMYRRGVLPRDHSAPFTKLLTGLYTIYAPITTGIQFPARAHYESEYGIKSTPAQMEVFIGEDVFYFQQIQGNLLENPRNPLFGNGWSEPVKTPEGIVRKTASASATLHLPMFFKSQVPVMVELGLLAEKPGSVVLEFYLNGEKLAQRPIGMKAANIRLPLPAKKYKKDVNTFRIEARWKDNTDEFPTMVLDQLRFYRAARRKN